MDRRRWASLVAIAVAGFASLATTPPTPSPPPSVDKSTTGSAHLSAGAPVVVQELSLRFNNAAVSGGPPVVSFTPTALLEATAGKGDVRLSVMPAELTGPGDQYQAFRVARGAQTQFGPWRLTCDGKICEGKFALVVEWLDAAAGETVDVDWDVKAHVDLWSGGEDALPPVEFSATDAEPSVDAAVTSAVVHSAEPARLDVENRLALWRVSMTLGDGPLESGPYWPLIIKALLIPTSTTFNPPTEGEAAPPRVFIQGADEFTSGGFNATQPGDGIEFQPFGACLTGEPCKVDYVIGLRMSDARPEVALDAGWNLDVRAIAVDGVKVPVEVGVAPVPPMPIVSVTTMGTMILGGEPGHSFRYAVTEGAVASGDRQWHGLPLPTFGIVRARATWTGSTPVPPGFFVTFGPVGSPSSHLAFDGETVFAFTPSETCQVDSCELNGDLYASAGGGSGAFPKDWGVTIDWELEVGMGTTATDGKSKLTITEITQP
jgi:hypothetical protein